MMEERNGEEFLRNYHVQISTDPVHSAYKSLLQFPFTRIGLGVGST